MSFTVKISYVSPITRTAILPPSTKALCIAKTCLTCTDLFFPTGRRAYGVRYCQDKCRQASHELGRREKCLGCGASGRHSRRAEKYRGYCIQCRPVASKSAPPKKAAEKPKRQPLGQKYLLGDYDGLLTYIESTTHKTESGCWEWNGKVNSGYGQCTIMVNGQNRFFSSHRLALECKIGRPFVEHAHHICSNRLCCNPDHLELATANENIAEMLARQSFIKRIAELESQVDSLTARVQELEATVSLSKSL